MSWPATQLAQLHDAVEIVLLMHRAGHDDLRVPVWVVVVGEDAYVRSWKGAGSVWFRRALADADQAIVLAGVTIPVRFVPVDDFDDIVIGDGYRAKYSRYPESYIDPMVAPKAVETTMRLDPR
jgi:hypothetical protein